MLITLLTDFGTADYFVAAMKAVALNVDPAIRFVDITHEVPPQDVHAAAFTLLAVYADFPAGTVHLAVVDPGVGSARRPLVVEAGGHRFVGPDNGLFGWILEREVDARAYHVRDGRRFRDAVSPTFHGRDVFAPIAAALATGTPAAQLGAEVDDAVRLAPLRPARREDGALDGEVLHVDRFGNCVTNLTPDDLGPEGFSAVELEVQGRTISTLRRFYAEAVQDDRPFGIWGSAGFLEISVNGGSAARLLGATRGAPVRLTRRRP